MASVHSPDAYSAKQTLSHVMSHGNGIEVGGSLFLMMIYGLVHKYLWSLAKGAENFGRYVQDLGSEKLGLQRQAAALFEMMAWQSWWLPVAVCWLLMVVYLSRRQLYPLKLTIVSLVGWLVIGVLFSVLSKITVGALSVIVVVCVLLQMHPTTKHAAIFQVQRPTVVASPWLLPGFLGLMVLSNLFLQDYSLFSHRDNRYYWLRHQEKIATGLVILSLVMTLRAVLLPIFVQSSARLFSSFGTGARATTYNRVRGLIAAGIFIVVPPSLVIAVQSVASNADYITGEGVKLALLFSAASLFAIREQTLDQITQFREKIEWVWPLLALLIGIGLGVVVSKDFGPFLVILLFLSLLVGAFLGVHWMFIGLASVVVFVFLASKVIPVVGERMDSFLHPFSSVNDQLAYLLWFRAETPAFGFAFGDVPWCGWHSDTTCRGMPLQTQSDYVFTGLYGIFGWFAWGLLVLNLFWLLMLGVVQGRSSRHDAHQQWLKWLGICFALLMTMQLLVTVAGNMAWFPLTGITWPFISYGLASWLAGALVLGFLINREP